MGPQMGSEIVYGDTTDNKESNESCDSDSSYETTSTVEAKINLLREICQWRWT